MSVIGFPKQKSAARHEMEDFADHGGESEFDADDNQVSDRHHGKSIYPDYDSDYRSPPVKPLGLKPRQTKRRLTPAEVLVRSLLPSVGDMPNTAPTTPADVLANAMFPVEIGSAQELLRQSFWRVWLQHRDYLKKKVTTSWTAIARTPKML